MTRASSNRFLMDLALSSIANKPQPFFETQHVSTLVALVEAGVGIAAVPSICMPSAAHPNLVSIPLVEPVVSRKIGLIRRAGSKLSPAAQKLSDEILAASDTKGGLESRPLPHRWKQSRPLVQKGNSTS
ncbi:LysR substrate-binding domain-containing protein [Microvirga sp. TS319]|uniref:LysR substrate-binding domain-containing protein n=1 Tax=Microvirga sp. TS319 TaxID=3241165 RepID=UPI00351A57D9